MLWIILGFLAVTSLAFGIPFLMGGNDRAVSAQHGIGLAVVASMVYVGAVLVFRG